MLRPATPLTILLLVAFILLLLSVISTPIIKAIPLATYKGVDFGVFGYCKSSGCTGINVGYATGALKLRKPHCARVRVARWRSLGHAWGWEAMVPSVSLC